MTPTSKPQENMMSYQYGLTDPTDYFFIPDVNLSGKFWFKPDEDIIDHQVKKTSKLASALAVIPEDTKREMGHQINEMLQYCRWNGAKCGPR